MVVLPALFGILALWRLGQEDQEFEASLVNLSKTLSGNIIKRAW
jgi:hypothetical protein